MPRRTRRCHELGNGSIDRNSGGDTTCARARSSAGRISWLLAGFVVLLPAACSSSRQHPRRRRPTRASPPAASAAAPSAVASAAQLRAAEPVTIHWLTHNPSETAGLRASRRGLGHPVRGPNIRASTIERDIGDRRGAQDDHHDPSPERRRGPRELGHRAWFAGLAHDSGLLAPLDDAYAKYNWPIYPLGSYSIRGSKALLTYGVPDQIEGTRSLRQHSTCSPQLWV